MWINWCVEECPAKRADLATLRVCPDLPVWLWRMQGRSNNCYVGKLVGYFSSGLGYCLLNTKACLYRNANNKTILKIYFKVHLNYMIVVISLPFYGVMVLWSLTPIRYNTWFRLFCRWRASCRDSTLRGVDGRRGVSASRLVVTPTRAATWWRGGSRVVTSHGNCSGAWVTPTADVRGRQSAYQTTAPWYVTGRTVKMTGWMLVVTLFVFDNSSSLPRFFPIIARPNSPQAPSLSGAYTCTGRCVRRHLTIKYNRLWRYFPVLSNDIFVPSML